MRFTYNKDVLGKEVPYCGVILGVYAVRWELMHNRVIRSYTCFNPNTAAPTSMQSITGYEDDNAWVDMEPKFKLDEQVILRETMVAEQFNFRAEPLTISHIDLVYSPLEQFVIYRFKHEDIIEEKLISMQQFNIAKELYNANKQG